MAEIISTTQHEHVITYANGKKRVARLFLSHIGGLCEYNKRSRRYGHYLDKTGIVDIVPLDKSKDLLVKTRKFVNKVISILGKNGLWSNMLADFKIIATLDNERLERLLNAEWDESVALANEIGLSHRQGGVDCLKWTVEKGIKRINYEHYDKDRQRAEFAAAIAEKRQWSHYWRKGYDNSVECKLGPDGIMRAWYSEEYKGCGNGHYYYAIDEKHAIFGDDD